MKRFKDGPCLKMGATGTEDDEDEDEDEEDCQ
jgi:hypothetical protein